MDKEKEMKILQSLKGGGGINSTTYFGQYFSDKDIDTMCDNIRNDIAIELNCQFDQPRILLNKQAEHLNKVHEDNIRGLMVAMHADDPDFLHDDTNTYHFLLKKYGFKFVVTAKNEIGMFLTKEEVNQLIEMIKD